MTLYADISGERLDAFLARAVENLSRSGAQKLLEDGCVLLCGKPGRKNDKLKAGDVVEVTIPEPKAVDIAPKEMPLDILYEAVSATATVGLTRDLTPNLNAVGKAIIIGTMYLGRVGPISLALALNSSKKKQNLIKNPTEDISVG